MKVPRPSAPAAAMLLALLATSTPATASMLDCKKFVVDGHKFDLSKLGGPHSVVTTEFHPPSYTNTTYTLDICAFLKRSDDVPKAHQCTNGARVCGIKRFWSPDKKTDEVDSVIPIAGNLLDKGGKQFEWEAKRLKTSESIDDANKEGVRVTLKGGVFEGRTQRAVVEFRCNSTLEGTEGEWESEDKYVPGQPDTARLLRSISGVTTSDDGNDSAPEGYGERQLRKEDAALIWDSRKSTEDIDTLFLTWHTKYACESLGEDEGTDAPAKKHWGFFTWLVILIFLGIASYLIFGSWLNYNRYGARGWDLLPHGDTLRDIPYLLKDWTRRVLNTVQGSGSRGGYSAV